MAFNDRNKIAIIMKLTSLYKLLHCEMMASVFVNEIDKEFSEYASKKDIIGASQPIKVSDEFPWKLIEEEMERLLQLFIVTQWYFLGHNIGYKPREESWCPNTIQRSYYPQGLRNELPREPRGRVEQTLWVNAAAGLPLENSKLS
jgi:hypothetical protein